MPWSPFPMPEPEDVPHARLAPFRRRVGRFVDPQGRVGLLYIDSTVLMTQITGHLWWRHWSDPREAARVFVEYPNGRIEDHLLDGDVLDRAINDWEHGVFHDAQGEVAFSLAWLDDEESARAWEAFEG